MNTKCTIDKNGRRYYFLNGKRISEKKGEELGILCDKKKSTSKPKTKSTSKPKTKATSKPKTKPTSKPKMKSTSKAKTKSTSKKNIIYKAKKTTKPSEKIITRKRRETYYDILGIDENSSIDDIKSAYKKLSLKYHPDRNPEGSDMFIKINQAYKTLSDETRRKVYDLLNTSKIQSGDKVIVWERM